MASNGTSRYGKSKTARSMAQKAAGGLGSTVLSQTGSGEWADSWARSMCKMAGLEPDTAQFEQCRQRMIQKATDK